MSISLHVLFVAADKRGDCRPHWVNVSSDDLIRNLILRGSPGVQEGVETLLAGGSVESRIDEHVNLRDMEQSRAPCANEGRLRQARLPEAGACRCYRRCELMIPNREVGVFFRTTIAGFLAKATGDERLKNLLDSLLAGDVENFEAYLQELVAGVLSFHDTSDDPERVYHAFVPGLLVNLGGRYHVKSNRESGYGRYDAALIPLKAADLGIVFEFERFHPKKDADVETALTDAIAQMRKKDYASEVRESGAERVLGLAIVFKGKEVTVRGVDF